MSLPFFYTESIAAAGELLILDEDNSRHVAQVLRMQAGEKIRLTDGLGHAAEAIIVEAHKKHCSVRIADVQFTPKRKTGLTIAISLVKNTARFEWFLEKAAELGTSAVIPLLCDRTEKQHARHDRFVSICKSAMLQSSQVWITVVSQPVAFSEVVTQARQQQKLIAHCAQEGKQELFHLFDRSLDSQMILIGPEGDFTGEEIALAKQMNFHPVSLGHTRLRTETAGMYAAVIGNS